MSIDFLDSPLDLYLDLLIDIWRYVSSMPSWAKRTVTQAGVDHVLAWRSARRSRRKPVQPCRCQNSGDDGGVSTQAASGGGDTLDRQVVSDCLQSESVGPFRDDAMADFVVHQDWPSKPYTVRFQLLEGG